MVRHPCCPAVLGLPQTEVVIAAVAAVDAMTDLAPVVMMVVVIGTVVAADLVCS